MALKSTLGFKYKISTGGISLELLLQLKLEMWIYEFFQYICYLVTFFSSFIILEVKWNFCRPKWFKKCNFIQTRCIGKHCNCKIIFEASRLILAPLHIFFLILIGLMIIKCTKYWEILGYDNTYFITYTLLDQIFLIIDKIYC